MPESISQEPDKHEEEQFEFQRQYDERIAGIRLNMEHMYDEAVAEGKKPTEILLAEDFNEGRKIFGDEAMDNFIAFAKALEEVPRDEFIEQVTARIGETVRPVYFDPEVKARAEALRLERDARNAEYATFGHLKAKVQDFEWEELRIGDDATLTPADKVIEISWPGDESDPQPSGAQDIKKSFQEVAKYIADHPEVKAVIAVSWMMSRGAAQRLGFITHPEVVIEDKQKAYVVDWASKARADKPYVKGVKPEDVKLGVIGRDEFLRRYGS